ncbi:hypothetical protein LXL04_020209 [Taraxacum kok-saghyz]
MALPNAGVVVRTALLMVLPRPEAEVTLVCRSAIHPNLPPEMRMSSDHGQLRDGETQTRASHRISHDPKDYAALGFAIVNGSDTNLSHPRTSGTGGNVRGLSVTYETHNECKIFEVKDDEDDGNESFLARSSELGCKFLDLEYEHHKNKETIANLPLITYSPGGIAVPANSSPASSPVVPIYSGILGPPSNHHSHRPYGLGGKWVTSRILLRRGSTWVVTHLPFLIPVRECYVIIVIVALFVGTYPREYSIREVRGSRPIPGLGTSAAYTTKSALLFVVQVLIRSLLYVKIKELNNKVSILKTNHYAKEDSYNANIKMSKMVVSKNCKFIDVINQKLTVWVGEVEGACGRGWLRTIESGMPQGTEVWSWLCWCLSNDASLVWSARCVGKAGDSLIRVYCFVIEKTNPSEKINVTPPDHGYGGNVRGLGDVIQVSQHIHI